MPTQLEWALTKTKDIYDLSKYRWAYLNAQSKGLSLACPVFICKSSHHMTWPTIIMNLLINDFDTNPRKMINSTVSLLLFSLSVYATTSDKSHKIILPKKIKSPDSGRINLKLYLNLYAELRKYRRLWIIFLYQTKPIANINHTTFQTD